jgi:prolipoprotein diacylglyceryltransferase
MYPEILHISFLHTYGALVALAFLVGLWMASRLAKRAGLNVEAATNL